MSKPTDTQKDVCNYLIKEICWWRDSNDIDSPTHLSDMEDCMKADLDGICSDHEIELLTSALRNLYHHVRYLAV